MYQINEKYEGIYIVDGAMFPVQIIVSKRLSWENNVWIKSLNKGLEADKLACLLQANKQIKQKTSLEAGLIDKWEAQGMKKGIIEGKAEGKTEGIHSTLLVIKGLKNNVPIERLAEEASIPIEEVEKIKSELHFV